MDTNLLILKKKLEDNYYTPDKVYLWKINKESGDIRTTYKRNFEDNIIEIAVLNILGPSFENLMDDHSFGNRLDDIDNPNHHIYKPYWESYKEFENNKKDALRSSSEFNKLVRSDIISFFDKINVETLVNFLRSNNVPARVLDLIESFLQISTEVHNENIVPQGTFLAPFLANIYLIPFDVYLREKGVNYYFRYVDDFFIILDEDKDEKIFFSKIETFLKEKLSLELHTSAIDPDDEKFNKSFIGNITEGVREKLFEEFKKRLYSETRVVEHLAKSGKLKSSLFLQIVLLHTNQREEDSFSKRELIDYTRRFLTYWRKTIPGLSDHREIEKIAIKVLKINQIFNVNTIRLFLCIIIEANKGSFSIMLKNFLKNPPSNIIRDAFISIIPQFLIEENLENYEDIKEILKTYIEDNDIEDYIIRRICQMILLMQDAVLINFIINLNFTPYLIESYQLLDNLNINLSISKNQFNQAFNFKRGILVISSYKLLNNLNLAQEFFDYCSHEPIINRIISDEDWKYLILRLLIYCDGLNPINPSFNVLFDMRDSFTLQVIETIIDDFLNIQNVKNLGVTHTKYFNILQNFSNFFNHWDLNADIKQKIDLKLISYVRESGTFSNYPFATLFPNISFRKISPAIIREIRTSCSSILDIFEGISGVNNIESSQNLINDCFGELTMVTNITLLEDEYCIEYQIPRNFISLAEIIKSENIPYFSILKILGKIIHHLNHFREKTGLPYNFLNTHNIFMNHEANEVKIFGFFPNLEKKICKYTPLSNDNIVLDFYNKSDFESLGYLLIEIFSTENISSMIKLRKNRYNRPLEIPYLNYIIFEKLLNNKYERIYNSFDILKKDIDYTINKWPIYENGFDEFYKIIDFTTFKLTKWIYVIQDQKLPLFKQGYEIFNYLIKSNLINTLEKTDNHSKIKKDKESQLNKTVKSIFGKDILKMIYLSKQELNKCHQINETEKKQCFLNFQSIFTFLLTFCELERYFTHFISFIIEEVNNKIKKIKKKSSLITNKTIFTIKNTSLKANILEMLEVIINPIKNLTSKDILENFYNFDDITIFLQFFTSEMLLISPTSDNNNDIEIEPILKDMVNWDLQTQENLKRIKDIYENITKIPISKNDFLNNQKVLISILKWLKESNISLKIYNKKIGNFIRLFEMQEFMPIEIKFWSFFKKRIKNFKIPYMIPTQNVLPDEKEIFPIEFIRRRFKPKIPSFIYPIQYTNQWDRSISYLKIHKWDFIIIIIEVILIISAFLSIDFNYQNLVALFLIGLFLPIIKIIIENLKK